MLAVERDVKRHNNSFLQKNASLHKSRRSTSREFRFLCDEALKKILKPSGPFIT